MFAIRIKHSGWRTAFLRKDRDPETFDPSKMSLFPLTPEGAATFETQEEAQAIANKWMEKLGNGWTFVVLRQVMKPAWEEVDPGSA